MHVQHSPWHHQRHHTADGFRNIWGAPRDVPFLKAASWLLAHALRQRLHRPPPLRRVDPAQLRARPRRLRVTWIGHASLLIQTPTRNLLTDPIFSARASPLPFAGPKRQASLPMTLGDLPPIDGVLLSHDHYDHLDRATIRHLAWRSTPTFFVPLGVASILRGWGVRPVVEMDWWDYIETEGLRLYCTPARHFSGRSLFNRNDTLWAGWYVESDALKVFYAGDSAYADHFTRIRERLGAPALACLPIGAYEPRWFMRSSHMNPEEAVQAFRDLGAGAMVGMHWGTFRLTDEPPLEPPRRTRTAWRDLGLPADHLYLPAIGQTLRL